MVCIPATFRKRSFAINTFVNGPNEFHFGWHNAVAIATFAAVKRILALDYGGKRCGLALSDPLGMIANGLETEPTQSLMQRLHKINREQGFSKIVIGKPMRMSGDSSDIETEILKFIEKFSLEFPEKEITRFDERFTSKMALNAMIAAGATKKQRQEKGNIDKVSATIILQEYLNQ